MAFTHGSKAILKVAGNAWTAYLDAADEDFTADTAETTVLGLTSKTHIPGLKDGKFTLAGKVDPTIDGYLATALGISSSFEYGPQGNVGASGTPKYTGNLIVTHYKVATPVNGAATFTAEAQVTGDVTRATY